MELYKIKHIEYSHLERLVSVTEAVLMTERIIVMFTYGTQFVAWNSHLMHGVFETVLVEGCQR